MTITSTLQAINEKILSLDCGVSTAEITTVDTQESYDGGVLVLVTGYLTGRDNIRRKFTQSFFLAPQKKGYFVLNDMFRYVGEVKNELATDVATDSIEASAMHYQENQAAEQEYASSKGVDVEELLTPPENGHLSAEEKAPIPDVVNEVSAQLPKVVVVETDCPVEDVSKRSYASILKVMKENAAPVSAGKPRSRVRAAVQEQQVAAAASPAPLSEKSDSNANAIQNGNNRDEDAVGPSIYLKGLPLNATPALLETEFMKFGPIRDGGIQVRSQKGFCFGFVEFEKATSVQSAVEASPIMINGRRVVAEEKRSTSRGNSRPRPYASNNGYRSEGSRGRGNYGGGRGYGRGEFNHRSEYGNRGNVRGGYSNRGGDGMHRANGGYSNRGGDGMHRANGGYSNRGGDGMHRANGGYSNRGGDGMHRAPGPVAVNAAAKSVAPRVTSTA